VRKALFSVLVAGALGCAPPAAPPPALVIAGASSLTDVVPRIAAAQHLVVESHFDASSSLARQIEVGAPVDVFLSADEVWADHVIAAGFAGADDRVPFASNHVVVVVPRDATTRPATLADLASLEHVAVAAAEVPAGRLARAALEHEGLSAAMHDRLVDAPNVRGALAWVTRGEAEAAIVYATDARVEPAVVVAFEVPADAAPPAVDVAVALHGDHRAAALAFVHALRSPESQAALAEAGLGPPP
jgi:molybdate transport system substrate-binding protein